MTAPGKSAASHSRRTALATPHHGVGPPPAALDVDRHEQLGLAHDALRRQRDAGTAHHDRAVGARRAAAADAVGEPGEHAAQQAVGSDVLAADAARELPPRALDRPHGARIEPERAAGVGGESTPLGLREQVGAQQQIRRARRAVDGRAAERAAAEQDVALAGERGEQRARRAGAGAPRPRPACARGAARPAARARAGRRR